MYMQTVRVGRIEDFEDPGKKVISVDDQEIGVFRLGRDFYAWRNICPHQGGPVCQGRLFNLVLDNIDDEKKSHGRLYDEDRLNIVCPWHGLEFDIRTGRHPGNPEMALQGVEVHVQADEVHVII
jgi:nitrite reductase (NADH) small subunit